MKGKEMWKPTARYLYEVAVRIDNQTASTWINLTLKVRNIYRDENRYRWKCFRFRTETVVYCFNDVGKKFVGARGGTPKEAYKKCNQLVRKLDRRP